jgi:hypothetical protein
MDIQVRIKTVYGKDLVYPVCKKAKLFAVLTGSQTFNNLQITAIKNLGFTVNVVHQPQTL